MDTKYLKNVFTYIISALLAIGIGYYVLYHAFDGFSSALTTAPALLVTESVTESSEAYIFRDEKVVYSKYSGAVNYLVSDGEKVGVGSELAKVYEDGDGGSQRKRVEQIDAKIALLQASNIEKNIVVSDTAKIDAAISELYFSAMEKIASGDLSYAMLAKDEMLASVNKRKIIVGEVKNYDTQIAAFSAERAAIMAQLGGNFENISTSESGYFFFDVDGYESVFSAKNIDGMLLSDFKEAFSSEKTEQSTMYPVGKTVSGHVWYIAVPLSKSALVGFEVGERYSVSFPYNYDTKITMTLERSVTESGSDEAVLVFSCATLPEGFNYLRCQSVVIEKKGVSGYRIPTSALRMVDGREGVYILYGSTVHFRRVEVILEKDGYFIVAERDITREDASEFLGVSDTVITRGKDLYDGKIIE